MVLVHHEFDMRAVVADEFSAIIAERHAVLPAAGLDSEIFWIPRIK